jgi:hypothetical protein
MERVDTHNITYKIDKTQSGIQVLLTGGDLPHIGAVSVIGPDTELHTVTFPGHKEAVISEKWAMEIFAHTDPKQPVVVSCGIHYDGITAEGIRLVIERTDELLEKILDSTL